MNQLHALAINEGYRWKEKLFSEQGRAQLERLIPVVEQTLETAALMLGSGKSRGYCLEMICADFLAGANLEGANPEALLLSVKRLLAMLLPEQRQQLSQEAETVP